MIWAHYLDCAHSTLCAEAQAACSCGRRFFAGHVYHRWHGRTSAARWRRALSWAARQAERLAQKCEASHGIY